MVKFSIEIRVDYNYLECEFSPDTPMIFASAIRQMAKEYFKDVTHPKERKTNN